MRARSARIERVSSGDLYSQDTGIFFSKLEQIARSQFSHHRSSCKGFQLWRGSYSKMCLIFSLKLMKICMSPLFGIAQRVMIFVFEKRHLVESLLSNRKTNWL